MTTHSRGQQERFWNERRDATLKRMRAEGVTTDDIAAALGCTRNAVVGRATRKGYETPNKPRKPINGRPRTNGERRKPLVKQTRAKVSARAVPGPKLPVAPQPTVVEHEPDAQAIPKDAAWDALPGSSPVPVHDHTTGCRWPIGDPLKDGFGFCNETPDDGSSYCAAHRALGRRESHPLTKPRKGTVTFKNLGEAVQRVFG